MSVPLLATKLYFPPARTNIVPRPHLVERLKAGLQGPLTLISAPAGAGKTTLMSEWRSGIGKHVSMAWLSLDTSDNDPARFLLYLTAALETVKAGLAGNTALLMQSPQLPPLDTILTSLIQELNGFTYDLVLALDDYHVITNLIIHEALDFLLSHFLPSVHLVILTRSDPPLPIARLRVRNQLMEIRAEHLRFTTAETAAFLQGMGTRHLSEGELTELAARTEGWIAGLQLAALSMQGRDDVSHFISTFTGSHHYVVDFLVNEVLSCQPEVVQTFLMQTSILERMTSALCNAVTGQLDGLEILESLERDNLFLIPLDDKRHWYRYHHLFADVLLSFLEQGQLEHIPELHRRAAEWFEKNGLIEEAISHALSAQDLERAARLIERHALPIITQGQTQLVLRWLNSIPESLILEKPKLCLYHAIILLFNNQPENARIRLQESERIISDDGSRESRTLLGWAHIVRSAISVASGDMMHGVAYAREALNILPETATLERVSAAGMFTRAYQYNGDVTPQTESVVAEMAAQAQASGSLIGMATCLTNLGRLYILQGRLHEAAATFNRLAQAMPDIAVLKNMLHGAGYFFGLADISLEWNDLTAANQQMAAGLNLVRGIFIVPADVATFGYLTLAQLRRADGDTAGALAAIDEFEQLSRQRHYSAMFIDKGNAARARIWLASGKLALAVHWAETSELHADEADLPYPSEYGYLTLARVYIAQGKIEQTVGLLDRLLKSAEVGERMDSVIEILVLRGLALQMQDNIPQALASLERGLVIAEPEGYLRIFLDEGEPMAKLLRHAGARGIATRYVSRLLPEFEKRSDSPSIARQPLIDPLSVRELEVLGLLAAGMSNSEIARQLVISIGTVKRHTSNIFGKLNVESRTQCVKRASELKLL